MKVKCFEVVSTVVEEATKQFAPTYKIRKEDYKILKQYCEIIDKLSDEADGVYYEVEVDDILMTVSVTIGCNCFCVTDTLPLFGELVKRSVMISFIRVDEDDANVKFTFPSLWERA